MRPMIRAVNLEPYLQPVNIEQVCHELTRNSNHRCIDTALCFCVFQVVTNACLIKHMNLYTVAKCDYKRFDAPFCLNSGCDAAIGAFFTYFDIEFTEGVIPITFTIQPGWPQTCWNPLIFFLSLNDFEIDRDETFYGVFRMNALSDDYRHIDWNIEVMQQTKQRFFRESWDFQTR